VRNPAILFLLLLAAPAAWAGIIDRTVTVDFPADSPDSPTVLWKGVDFETGTIIASPRFGAPNWHLRLRQGYVSTNCGAAALIETGDFDSVREAPADASKYVADRIYDPWGPAPEDTYNEKVMDWFEYFFWKGHLLAPKPYVYFVRTSGGLYAKIQFTDYVKNGKAIRDVNGKKKDLKVAEPDNQVHVTFRVRINDSAGDRALAN
jgi:hypothetical protein